MNLVPKEKNFLKIGWQTVFSFNWKLGLALIILFGVTRLVIVLEGIQTGNNSYVSLLFMLMIFSPFILLNRAGRKSMGIKFPRSWIWLIASLLLGGFLSYLTYFLGEALYSGSTNNWFVYIGKSYPIDLSVLPQADKQIYFIIFCVIGSFFSPLGEELLYRGLIHTSLLDKFGSLKASIIDSLAFGLTHLAHFGIIYSLGEWSFLPIPAVLWIILMFLTGMLFNWCRAKSDSIWGAVTAHIGFNIVMTYCIFYLLN